MLIVMICCFFSLCFLVARWKGAFFLGLNFKFLFVGFNIDKNQHTCLLASKKNLLVYLLDILFVFLFCKNRKRVAIVCFMFSCNKLTMKTTNMMLITIAIFFGGVFLHWVKRAHFFLKDKFWPLSIATLASLQVKKSCIWEWSSTKQLIQSLICINLR